MLPVDALEATAPLPWIEADRLLRAMTGGDEEYAAWHAGAGLAVAGAETAAEVRERIVPMTFSGSFVANTNFTCSGGSSTILSSALKPCGVTMCASSMM